MLRLRQLFQLLFLSGAASALLLAQSDRGNLTGTVTDPGGAVIAAVEITATNHATGTVLHTVTTDTGNYTIPSVPAGEYNVSAEARGFKKLIRSGVTISVDQSARVDFGLEIGSVSDSIQVTADASLLKTESAENSQVVTGDTINDLPLNFAGAGAIRDPLSFAELAPGTTVGGWNEVHINGSPGSMYRIILEGQDSGSSLQPRVSDESQPSVEAIQEFALQSNNYAAEFGQSSGGLFNFTMRSGTNQLHGSLYEYFANDALNAGNPNTDDGTGKHQRAKVRENDFGGSVGGPVWVPKVYNGHDKTFFFFNYEMYRNLQTANGGLQTLPTDAYRNGDFSYLLTGRNLGTDPLGRSIMEGAIYDPATTRTVNGAVVRDPFPGNIIPVNRFDPVAAKIQNLIPSALNGNPVFNYPKIFPSNKIQWIPSIKIDHNLTQNARLAGYFSWMETDKDNGGDGLPDPISARRYQTIKSKTARISYDQIITPTLILHLGVGYQRYHNPDTTPITDYNSASQLGLVGAVTGGFPVIQGLNVNGQGLNLGPSNYQLYLQDKPTAVASMTWVRGSHSYKWGGEWRIETFSNIAQNGGTGNYGFDASETGLPSTNGQDLNGGFVGNSYASFLLGQVNSASISNAQSPQFRRHAWAGFAQDTWKITRKLTLDYGLRYDFQVPEHELHYRTTEFDPTLANPSMGGLLGAALFEGNGTGRCNCKFEHTYPYSIGPRIGVAFQLDDKTVLRAGWGLFYGQLSSFNYQGGGSSLGFGFNTVYFNSPGFGLPTLQLQNGLSYDAASLYGVNLNPGIQPTAGQLGGLPSVQDGNDGRPPRLNTWNISIQRQLSKDLTVEAAYVGNRGVWFRSNGLVDLNALTPQRLSSLGLNINNADDRALLQLPVNAPQVAARGFSSPYAGFPTDQSLAQALRPFPGFGYVGVTNAPLGNSWYDALQAKITKRLSHGLDGTIAYTWSKNLATVSDEWQSTVPTNDVFNRANQKTIAPIDQPQVLTIGFHYAIPNATFVHNGFARTLLTGWETGGIFRYASGMPIQTPGGQNGLYSLLFRGTFSNRVAGQPLFLKDLNCHCIDPSKDLVLNPAAWSDPAPGQWGTAAAYYTDYRYQRRPSEQISLGKVTRIRESMSFEVRAEFFNVFNRAGQGDPQNIGNALTATQVSGSGQITNGFGYISPTAASGALAPRSGQIVARLRF